MKKLLLTVFVFLTTTIAFAQSTAPSRSVPQEAQSAPQAMQNEKKVQWGVKGGLNSAYEQADKGQTYARAGIHIGFFLETPVSAKVGFQPELVYSMQGGGGDELNYINLPLIFKFYVWQQRLSIDVGPQFGYLINAKLTKNGTTIDIYDYATLNKFDASIGLGVSYKFTDKFDINWRVNVGMTKILDNLSHTNCVVQLGVGYRF